MSLFAGKAAGPEKPLHATLDWSKLKDDIVSRLDVAVEYMALGIVFTKPSADVKHRRECHAIGRPDLGPSAFVNVVTGVYHDSGGDGESLHLFAFATRHGGFGRWIDAARHYATKVGVSIGKVDTKVGGRTLESRFDYLDENGDVRYAVFRYVLPNGKKTFTQHPPDGKGAWKYGAGCMDGIDPLPYRLPSLLDDLDSVVFIAEGEKAVDALVSNGLLATTNHGGTGNTDKVWPRLAEHFRGRDVVVIPDNDSAGRHHANKVCVYLAPVASRVRFLELPGLSAKGDAFDWFAEGGLADELKALAERTPTWEFSVFRPSSDQDQEQGDEHEEGSWEEPKLGKIPPAVPFPVDVFPVALAELVREASEALTCPPDFLAIVALTVASVAIGRSVSLSIKDGWVESPAIYAAIVGDPGATKSPALSLISRPIWTITDELLAEFKRAKEQAEADETPIPVARRVHISDVTVESIAPILQDNPRGLIMIRDELTAWVAGHNQYKSGGKGSDRQFYLSAWSGSPVTVDRKNNPDRIPIHVPHPFLSVVGCLTPGMLCELSESKDRDDGFIDRILFASPEAVRVRWSSTGIPTALADEWLLMVRRLWNEPMTVDAEGQLRPWVVKLSSDALVTFGSWFNAHCEETEAANFPSYLVGPWAKMRAYCARLALVVQRLRAASCPDERSDPVDVDAASVRDAIHLVDYFKAHARRVHSLIRGSSGPDDENARAILKWVKGGSLRSFTHRDLNSNFRSRRSEDPEAIDKAILWLTERRCVRVCPPPEEIRRPGRKPSPTYEVNPALLRDTAPD